MKPVYALVLTLVLSGAAAAAQDTPPAAAAATPAAAAAPDGAATVLTAAEARLADLQWIFRPVIVFADTDQDQNFIRQMELIARDRGDLAERDVVVIADTDPAARSEVRQRFRPRGFALVLVDKDGMTTLRKPLPWDVREIVHAIDRFPTRRQEVLERYPSGR